MVIIPNLDFISFFLFWLNKDLLYWILSLSSDPFFGSKIITGQ